MLTNLTCFIYWQFTIGDAIPPRQACISLLKYIYYDCVSLTSQDALHLVAASHYFQFSNLRVHVFCKQYLEASVSENNVIDVILLIFCFFLFWFAYILFENRFWKLLIKLETTIWLILHSKFSVNHTKRQVLDQRYFFK